MSIHKSLKKRRIKTRSVLKRHERLAKALREEKWKEGMSVYQLPKFNPPKLRLAKIKDEAQTSLGKVDILEQHKLTKEKSAKEKKSRKKKKEITGRK